MSRMAGRGSRLLSLLMRLWAGLQAFWRFIVRLRSPYWLFPILLLLLAGLQYRLWYGDGSLEQVAQLQKQIAAQDKENQQLLERNRLLEAEVMELKKGMETVEERARNELGMVKDGETLYQLPSNE